MNSLSIVCEHWTLCGQPSCREPAVQLNANHALWVQTTLMSSTVDPLRLIALRTVLLGHGHDWALCRMIDEEVIERIGHLVMTGCLHIHFKPQKAVPWAVSQSGAGASPSSRVYTPQSAPVLSNEPAPDPPTFTVPLDGAAQAAVLAAAAAQGQPFCPQ